MAALAAPAVSRIAAGQPLGRADPFTLGVASGAPLADAVVIWTRLAPSPLAVDGGLGPAPVAVDWEVAGDERFATIVRRGSFETAAATAHCVHVDVRGLAPARWYWYRFHAGGATSPVGRTRTAPAAGAPTERLRFAFASCAHYEQGFFAAFRHMAAEAPDLVVFLGDYVYEASWGRDLVRRYDMSPARTLAQYRTRYAQHRLDADLRAAHQAAPWIVTWDDHEVANDYADLRDESLDADFRARRAAGYQAFWEHMPLRGPPPRDWRDLRVYDRFDFGDLARFHVL
ncbi:MAG: alkaline phosphatase D family protein, partial [Alphaproteobacteria bacterium]|nr:alkaline phosphatase D family protein [Alphaproteobacteria bacterium]